MEAWPKREAFDDRGPAVPWELPANRRQIRRSGEACFFQAAQHSRVASCRRASALDRDPAMAPKADTVHCKRQSISLPGRREKR